MLSGEKSCWMQVNIWNHSNDALFILIYMGRHCHCAVVLGLGELQKRSGLMFNGQGHPSRPDISGCELRVHPRLAVWLWASLSGFLSLTLSLWRTETAIFLYRTVGAPLSLWACSLCLLINSARTKREIFIHLSILVDWSRPSCAAGDLETLELQMAQQQHTQRPMAGMLGSCPACTPYIWWAPSIHCVRCTGRTLYVVEQVSESKKPTAGVDLFVCALKVNGVPVVEIRLVGYCRDVVACGLVVLQTDPQLPPAEHRGKKCSRNSCPCSRLPHDWTWSCHWVPKFTPVSGRDAKHNVTGFVNEN